MNHEDSADGGPLAPPKIAIVGIAAELPSGPYAEHNLDHRQFYEFLLDGAEAYEDIPKSRFNADSWHGKGLGRLRTKRGTFLKDVDMFDPTEFGISSKDARAMSLSTRKLIELSFLALLDAGIHYRGQNVGCYAAGTAFDILTVSNPDELEAKGSFAGIPCMIANKISYHLDLRGPSIPIDTACSSSLTAFHLAVQALRAGECEAAVVGGCQLNMRPVDFIQYSQAGVLAPDGKCKPFDATADGFSRGEGAVVVVLKPYDQAVRDGDHIYANVLGTGINATGSLAPAYAPVGESQADAMRRAYKVAKVDPREADFIEMHATGTAAGDPVEATWVGEAFGRDEELLIGSVKGNIGHTEITAFLASLSKVCSMMEYQVIPPNVNLRERNAGIPWDKYKLSVPLAPTPLRARDGSGKLLISMNSSGIGGANGHVVLQSTGPPPPSCSVIQNADASEDVAPVLVLAGGLSPRSATAVGELICSTAQSGLHNWGDLSVISGRRVRQMTWRMFAVAKRTKEGHIALPAAFPAPTLSPRQRAPLVFLFSGQGPQHILMGRQLFQQYPVFRAVILELDDCHYRVTGRSLIQDYGLFKDMPDAAALPSAWPISVILPSLAMIQMALFDLLVSVGIKPDIVIGHSAGETALLYASGAASREMAMEIAIARGRAMELVERHDGTMASLSCSAGQAQSILEAVRSGSSQVLEIACYNSSGAVAVAGHEQLVDRAVEMATKYNIMARKIRTRVPVHSRMMEVCEAEYRSLIEDVFRQHPGPHNAQILTYSTCTGALLQEFDSEYFWTNTRNPVLFTKAVENILNEHRNATFVDIGPHPVLQGYLQELGVPSSSLISPMRRQKAYLSTVDEQIAFLQALGHFAVLGHNEIDFQALNNLHRAFDHKLDLAPYPFAKKPVPFKPELSSWSETVYRGPLNGPKLRINAQTHPDLADHVIHGEPIMPAAGFLEMALELGSTVLSNVVFHSVLALSSDTPPFVDVKEEGSRWSVISRNPKQNSSRTHATGYMFSGSIEAPAQLDVECIKSRCKATTVHGFYSGLAYFAQYGKDYRRVSEAFFGSNEALVKVNGCGPDLPNSKAFVFHPAVLDAAIHVTVHPSFTANSDPNIYYLPSRVERISFTQLFFDGSVPDHLYAHATLREWRPDELVTDVLISDVDGNLLCTVKGLVLARHYVSPERSPGRRFTMAYQPFTSSNGKVATVNQHPLASLRSCSKKDELLTLRYVVGQEMAIQDALKRLDQETAHTIWFTADHQNMHSARGFTRSLRQECPLWTVGLVSFKGCYSPEYQTLAAIEVASIPAIEHEVLIDANRNILIPRFVEIAGPTTTTEHTKPKLELPPDHVEIAVLSTSLAEAGAFGVHGRISAVGCDCDPTLTGTLVVAVVRDPPQSSIVVHSGVISTTAASNSCPNVVAQAAPLLLLGGSILGVPALRHPSRMRAKKIGITQGSVSTILSIFFKQLGIDVIELPARDTESLLMLINQNKLASIDILLTDIKDSRQILLDSALRPTRLIDWQSSLDGLLDPNSDPWTVGDTLQAALEVLKGVHLPMPQSIAPLPVTSAPPAQVLFDPTKSYVLIGGMGSLGLHICLWMYQNGARHIALTSRSGASSLEKAGDVLALRMLSYLNRRPDLELLSFASDASCPKDLAHTLSTLKRPLAGCMLLSGLLSDGKFLSQDAASFDAVFTPKLAAFEAVESVIDIGQLDFFLACSSIATFGNAGQTNYSSANTAIEGKCAKYPNAFAIVAPAISDTVSMVGRQDYDYQVARFQHLMSWAYSAKELCHCIGDGIRKVQNEAFDLYIPDLDWSLVRKNLGPSNLYDHLVETDVAVISSDSSDTVDDALRRTVLQFVDADESDFSSEVPLTSYGLDSISATRLSFALRPFLAVSQIQLLADMALDDILTRFNRQSGGGSGQAPVVDAPGRSFDWKTVDSTQPIVKLREVNGDVPLILLHGGSGTAQFFYPFQSTFTTSLWCLQVTPDTPLDTLEGQAQFYYRSVKAARPTGPYRLGGYCASAALLLFLAKLFEEDGDELIQLAVIDGSPLIFLSPAFELDEQSYIQRTPSEHVRRKVLLETLGLYKRGSAFAQKVAEEMERNINLDPNGHLAAVCGAPKHVQEWFRIVDAHTINIYKFFLGLLPKSSNALGPVALQDAVVAWMRSIRTPLTVFVADYGLSYEWTGSCQEERSRWSTLGYDWALPGSTFYRFEATHFDLVDRIGLVELLQRSA